MYQYIRPMVCVWTVGTWFSCVIMPYNRGSSSICVEQRGHHMPWENVSILSPGLTVCAVSVVVIIILVVVNGCVMFSCWSRNLLIFKHTPFLLPGLLLWPGWPGIAQLCQVFPSSVTWGAWACREVDENAEPEGGKDLPARRQGMSHTLIVEFGCVFHLA